LQGEREIAYPSSYIYRIAVSVTIRAIRRVRARGEERLPADSEGSDVNIAGTALQSGPVSSPESIAERGEWMRKIDASLARLAENRRLAVGLHLQGMTTVEIADLLGWTEPKARNLVHRGLKDLRRQLALEGIEYVR
ncbi:MAG: RNA polymerase sigma factor, partial [Myxococcota bacterium]